MNAYEWPPESDQLIKIKPKTKLMSKSLNNFWTPDPIIDVTEKLKWQTSSCFWFRQEMINYPIVKNTQWVSIRHCF